MKSQVILLPCDKYDENLIYEKLSKGLELAGGIENIISTDEKVLMKLNLVRGADPSRAVTTNPAVVAAVSRILYEKGYKNVKAGDSSGFGSAARIMSSDLKLDDTFNKYNVTPAEFKEAVHVDNKKGVHAKEFVLAKDVLDADAIISLPKMKTHALEYITGGVKNQYGCVQGFNKAKGHTAYPSQESFARMLIDLDLYVRPRLYIMDGIMAMEGNGPTSGDPTPMNVLLISTDPVAMDTVFCDLICLDPETVPTNVYGNSMGLGTCKEDEIEIVTPDGIKSFAEIQKLYGNPKFNVMREKHSKSGIMGVVTKLNKLKRKPKINPELCKRCGVCVEACPVEGKALHFDNGRTEPPVYNYKKCIRCFCCQEMCPHKAISV